MQWLLKRELNSVILYVNGEVKGAVLGIKPVKKNLQFLKVKLDNYSCLKLDFTNCVNEDLGSSSDFISKWKVMVAGDMSCGEESTQSSSDDSLQDPLVDESINFVSTASVITGGKAVNDREAKECLLGTCDVHVENLVPPCASRATRLLDMDHVKVLSESFQTGSNEQLSILVGMVPQDVNLDSLKEKGACKVETLGGNHTREALQGLLRRGLYKNNTVKVHIYSTMSQTTALMLGWQHNLILQEKQKSLTFMDKVRLMRQLLPSPPQTKEVVRRWKSQLATIFNVGDIRRLQMSYSHHLHMAQLPNEVWDEVEAAAMSIQCVTEKMFRNVMKLKDNDHIKECMTCLRREGKSSFNKIVKQYIDDGHTRAKNRKEVTQSEPVVEKIDDSLQRKYNELLEKYTALEDENSDLRLKNKQLEADLCKLKNGEDEEKLAVEEPECKRARRQTQKFTVGEHIEGFWRYEDGEEKWLPGKISRIYTNGDYAVTYEDGTARVPSSWVKAPGLL